MRRLVPLGLVRLPIAIGATTPAPSSPCLAWSTTIAGVVFWSGSAWKRL